MDRERTAAFEKLRPVCVSLTKEHSRENVLQVLNEVKSVKADFLQDLQEYILFPVRFIFKQQQQASSPLKEDLLCDVCECLQYVLSHTCVSRWEMFQDMFTSLSCILGSPDSIGKVAKSEELKLAVVKAFECLLKSADRELVLALFSPPSLPPLGHAVSVLLKLAETEKSREIQLAALDCLLCLSQADSKSGRKQKIRYGDIFASFLPGIAMALCRVVTGDNKQGYAVLSKSVEVWWKIVSLVLGDSFLQQPQSKEQKGENDNLSDKLRNLVVERSADWVKATGSKMAVLVKQIASVKTNSNWRVRLALVNWADKLLQNCSSSLNESVPVLLEVLVGMIEDKYPNVSDKSLMALETYKTSVANTDKARPLTEILEENLYALVTSLPRQVRMADEDQKLSAVNLLNGYLSLLGPNIKSLLYSLPHLRRLSLALVQSMELDCRDIKIVEHRTAAPGYGSGLIKTVPQTERSRKTFHHFRDERIEMALMKSCHLLGYYGDLSILTDHFLDIFSESSIYKIATTLILNEIIAGVHTGTQSHPDLQTELISPPRPVDSTELETLIRMLIEEYLMPVNFNLPTCVKPENGSAELSPHGAISVTRTGTNHNITVATLNQNIIQTALYVEGLGKFSLVLGQEFESFLIMVLYPLLEKLGDGNAHISSTAYTALMDICAACKYRSLDELIRQNADYLMNAISLRLRHLEANLKTPLVLQVMLQYSEADILPLIDDTVQEILSCLDDHYQEEAAMFMKVLYTLTKAVNRWFPPEKQFRKIPKQFSKSLGVWYRMKIVKEASRSDITEVVTKRIQNDPSPDKDTCTSIGQIRDFFLNYHRQKLIAEGNVEEEDYVGVTPEGDNLGEDDGMEIDKKPELPKHVTSVKEVLIRSKHLLSSNNPRLRLLVLDIINQAAWALSAWKNELLPLVHDMWQPFVVRFADKEKLVTIKAVKTLSTLCEVSGDFLKKRIFKDIIPKLGSFLVSQAKISMGSAQAYLYTVNYKLQMTCLSSLGSISEMVGARDVEVDSVATSYLPYLSCRQPHSLQEAGIKGVEKLIGLEPDVLWLKLSDLYTAVDLSPPGSQFRPVKLLSQPGQKNEFTDSVIRLLPQTWTEVPD